MALAVDNDIGLGKLEKDLFDLSHIKLAPFLQDNLVHQLLVLEQKYLSAESLFY